MKNVEYSLLTVDSNTEELQKQKEKFRGKFVTLNVRSIEDAVQHLNIHVPNMVLINLEKNGDGKKILRGINVLREQAPYRDLETAIMGEYAQNDPHVKEALELSTTKIYLKKPITEKAARELLGYMQRKCESTSYW